MGLFRQIEEHLTSFCVAMQGQVVGDELGWNYVVEGTRRKG